MWRLSAAPTPIWLWFMTIRMLPHAPPRQWLLSVCAFFMANFNCLLLHVFVLLVFFLSFFCFILIIFIVIAQLWLNLAGSQQSAPQQPHGPSNALPLAHATHPVLLTSSAKKFLSLSTHLLLKTLATSRWLSFADLVRFWPLRLRCSSCSIWMRPWSSAATRCFCTLPFWEF